MSNNGKNCSAAAKTSSCVSGLLMIIQRQV
jgi:hypothetical protein